MDIVSLDDILKITSFSLEEIQRLNDEIKLKNYPDLNRKIVETIQSWIVEMKNNINIFVVLFENEGKAPEQDQRPTATIPEDYYAL